MEFPELKNRIEWKKNPPKELFSRLDTAKQKMSEYGHVLKETIQTIIQKVENVLAKLLL